MIGWLLGGTPGPAGRLVWTAPDWVVVVAATLAVGAFLLAMRRARPWATWLAEAVCWGLALVGVVVALARPVWVEEQGRSEPGRVAILVDASASMSVREGDTPRSESALAILETLQGEGEVLHFGDTLAAGVPVAFSQPATDVEGALLQLSDRYAGEQLAGVVLITDGIDRGLLRRRWRLDNDPVVPRVPGPLTVFQVGTTGAVRDLSVRYVDAGGYAYVHAPFRIRAEVVGLGFEGQTVQVDLSKDGGAVSSRRVTLDEQGQGEVVFEVTPDCAGRFTYLVSVPDYDDDAVTANNVLPVVVRVVRDRIRVLQVAGAPSWDVKFLRRFLKGDPSIDLVSFFILRTRRDLGRDWRENELSLIQFPYRQLFTDDLRTFDSVVFQNFDYGPYFEADASALLGELRDFVVEDGHALVMTGGDRSFSLGRYGTTPLDEVLPVDVSTAQVPPDPSPFSPVLTEAGMRHPITRLVADMGENAVWWSRLHTLDGTNLGLTTRPDASVLLEHPQQRDQAGAPLPVLAVREVGRGRTMSLTVDTSWRWSLSEAAEGRGNQAYLRFWKGAIRWLVGDPTTDRVGVDTPRENYGVGDEVRIQVRARDADFAPLADAPVDVVVTSGADRWDFTAETDDEGEALVSFEAERRGAHRIDVQVGEGTRGLVASTVFAVTSRDPELDDVAPDGAFLQWLAERTEGRYYAPGDTGPILRDPSAGRVRFDRREVAVWRSPLVALWVGLFAGVAWILRRRVGLR